MHAIKIRFANHGCTPLYILVKRLIVVILLQDLVRVILDVFSKRQTVVKIISRYLKVDSGVKISLENINDIWGFFCIH